MNPLVGRVVLFVFFGVAGTSAESMSVSSNNIQKWIPNTNLWTDKQYQISANRRSGFNLLTYADVTSKSDGKFVQLDDHAQRESKYAPAGAWFEDSLWKFTRVNYEEPFVMIHHAKFPDRILALDADLESPDVDAPANHYLFLTSDPTYVDQGSTVAKNRQYGFWILHTTGDVGELSIQNLATGQFVEVAPRPTGNEFYQWVTAVEDDSIQYNFIIQAV